MGPELIRKLLELSSAPHSSLLSPIAEIPGAGNFLSRRKGNSIASILPGSLSLSLAATATSFMDSIFCLSLSLNHRVQVARPSQVLAQPSHGLEPQKWQVSPCLPTVLLPSFHPMAMHWQEVISGVYLPFLPWHLQFLLFFSSFPKRQNVQSLSFREFSPLKKGLKQGCKRRGGKRR